MHSSRVREIEADRLSQKWGAAKHQLKTECG